MRGETFIETERCTFVHKVKQYPRDIWKGVEPVPPAAVVENKETTLYWDR